jgi:hypothetical protein
LVLGFGSLQSGILAAPDNLKSSQKPISNQDFRREANQSNYYAASSSNRLKNFHVLL